MTTPAPQAPDLAAMRVVAEAASDEAWSVSDVKSLDGEFLVVGGKCEGFGLVAATTTREDAEHIAAFDPPAALALLDRAEQAESFATGWHSAVDMICTILGLRNGLGASEAIEAVRDYDTARAAALSAAEARVGVLEGERSLDKARIAELEGAVQPFAHVADRLAEMEDESIVRLVYDDPEWGDNTVLHEWFVRPFRRAALAAATPQEPR